MPIDINAVLAPFQTSFTREWRTITRAMELLALSIAERYQKALAMERATRLYPVIGFEQGAVMVAIGRSQRGVLGPSSPSFTMVDQVRQEMLIPGVVRVLSEMTGALRASAQRFQVPRADMFRLDRPSRFVDVFGHAFLLARTLIRDFDPLAASVLSSARSVARARREISGSPASPSRGAAAPETESGGGMDDVVRWIAGAILVVPAFTSWIEVFAREISIVVRMRLLNEFRTIERQLFDFRSSLLTDVLTTLREIGQSTMEFMIVAETILLSNIRYFGAFATVYSGLLIFTLSRLSDVIREQVNGVLKIVNPVIDVINYIMNIDLIPILLVPIIGPIGSRIPLPLPRFTLDDLVSLLTDVAGFMIGLQLRQLEAYLWAASGIADLLGMDTVSEKLDAVRRIFRGARRRIVIPAQPRITPLTFTFPDIWALLVTPFRGQWAAALTTLRDATGQVVERVLFEASGLMEGFANVLDQAASGSTWLGGPALWRRLTQSADQLSFQAFGAQAVERRARLQSHPDLPLANAFDRAVARGGFSVITEAIPVYIGGLILFWRDRRRDFERARESPVSPHILARRGRLVRVRVPRLALRVRVEGGLPTGERRGPFLETLAGRMRESVEQAWRTGELQVAR